MKIIEIIKILNTRLDTINENRGVVAEQLSAIDAEARQVAHAIKALCSVDAGVVDKIISEEAPSHIQAGSIESRVMVDFTASNRFTPSDFEALLELGERVLNEAIESMPEEALSVLRPPILPDSEPDHMDASAASLEVDIREDRTATEAEAEAVDDEQVAILEEVMQESVKPRGPDIDKGDGKGREAREKTPKKEPAEATPHTVPSGQVPSTPDLTIAQRRFYAYILTHADEGIFRKLATRIGMDQKASIAEVGVMIDVLVAAGAVERMKAHAPGWVKLKILSPAVKVKPAS